MGVRQIKTLKVKRGGIFYIVELIMDRGQSAVFLDNLKHTHTLIPDASAFL